MSAEPTGRPAQIECPTCPLGQAPGGAGRCSLRVHRFAPGEVLMVAGDVPSQLIHVKDAVVELNAATIHGAEQRYSLRGPGAVLGWEALSDLPLASDIRVLHGGDICLFPAEAARREMDTPLAAAFVGPLLRELALVQSELILSAQSAAARVARYLLSDISCVTGELNGSTARSIARQLGIRHETLSRVLHKLDAAGIVERAPFKILDTASLRRIVRTGHL